MGRPRGRGRGGSRRSGASSSSSHYHMPSAYEASYENTDDFSTATDAAMSNGNSAVLSATPANSNNSTDLALPSHFPLSSPTSTSTSSRTPGKPSSSQTGRVKPSTPKLPSSDTQPAARHVRSEKAPQKSSSNLTRSLTLSTPSTQTPQPSTPANNRGVSGTRSTRRSTIDAGSDIAAMGNAHDESVSKGGHSLRRRARVDYSQIDTETLDMLKAEPAEPNIAFSSRGRKRKIIAHDRSIYDDLDGVAPSVTKKACVGRFKAASPPPSLVTRRRRSTARSFSTPQPDLSSSPRSGEVSDNDVMDEIQVALESAQSSSDGRSSDPDITAEDPAPQPNDEDPQDSDSDFDDLESFKSGSSDLRDLSMSAPKTGVQDPQSEDGEARDQSDDDMSPAHLPEGAASSSAQRDGIITRKRNPKRLIVTVYAEDLVLESCHPGSQFARKHKEARAKDMEQRSPKSLNTESKKNTLDTANSDAELALANNDDMPETALGAESFDKVDEESEQQTSKDPAQEEPVKAEEAAKDNSNSLMEVDEHRVSQPSEQNQHSRHTSPVANVAQEPAKELAKDDSPAPAHAEDCMQPRHQTQETTDPKTLPADHTVIEGRDMEESQAEDSTSRTLEKGPQKSNGPAARDVEASSPQIVSSNIGKLADYILSRHQQQVSDNAANEVVNSIVDEVVDSLDNEPSVPTSEVSHTEAGENQDGDQSLRVCADITKTDDRVVGPEEPLASDAARISNETKTQNASVEKKDQPDEVASRSREASSVAPEEHRADAQDLGITKKTPLLLLTEPDKSGAPQASSDQVMNNDSLRSTPARSSPPVSFTDQQNMAAMSDGEEPTARLTPITPTESALPSIPSPSDKDTEKKEDAVPDSALPEPHPGSPEQMITDAQELPTTQDVEQEAVEMRVDAEKSSEDSQPADAEPDVQQPPEIDGEEPEISQLTIVESYDNHDDVDQDVEMTDHEENDQDVQGADELDVEADESHEVEPVDLKPWSHLTPYVADVSLYPELEEPDTAAPSPEHHQDPADEAHGELESSKDAFAASQDSNATGKDHTNGEKRSQRPRQLSYKKLRSADDFVDVIGDYKSMSTEDLYECLAKINQTLCAWQDEYVGHRKTLDAEFNAPRRRADEPKEDDRVSRALDRYKTLGVYDPDTLDSSRQAPKGFQLRRTLEPRKWYTEIDKDGDQDKADARANDKVMAQTYGFEYDSRELMIGKQEPLNQRDGPSKPRTRARPKTQKAAEAEEEGVLGKRARKKRILDDESRAPSRAATPVPVPTIINKPGRRGRKAAADLEPKEVEPEEPAPPPPPAPAPAPASAPAPVVTTRLGRSRRGAKAQQQSEPEASQESVPVEEPPAPPPVTRKRRRGANAANGDADAQASSQEVVEEQAAAAVKESTPAVTDNEAVEPSAKRARKKLPRLDLVRPASRPSRGEISSGNFYSNGPSVAPTEDNTEASRPSTSSSNATVMSAASNYSFRPKRGRNFREELNGGEPSSGEPKKKRTRRKGPAPSSAPMPAVPLAPAQAHPGEGMMHKIMHQQPYFPPPAHYPHASQHGSFGVMNFGPGAPAPMPPHPTIPMPHGSAIFTGVGHPHQSIQSPGPITNASINGRGGRELKIKNVTPSMVGGSVGPGPGRVMSMVANRDMLMAAGLATAPTSVSGGSVDASRANSPFAVNGDEPEKDYASMTKSEKMSHSMRSRWRNGSMQGAVAKRKETLRLKKAKAQEAEETPGANKDSAPPAHGDAAKPVKELPGSG
ncbi:hypothetical protein MCOR08_009063 [Pyricularia oryzae]|nr:hypothetical protein MCOR32_005096 [Pyricularia oryzae]KAI6501366.1 hypothetical protein MCOR11_002257 [Pyricularia oryzae]KAI6503832.1 hypothetical protein MCOR13_004975 [Pyricularia oryzae]KAI6618371.1 hypothetical protein MCOR08_009063 [Pyricularia oryzae]